ACGARRRREDARRGRRDSLPVALRSRGRDDSPRRRSGARARPPLVVRSRRRVRSGGARRAALRSRAGREAAIVTAVAVRIRPLELSDLASIEAIEVRAYPTPWSRSMFASELAKPTSVCLGAFEGDDLVGYVINSRYVDAWHVMNVAVDPDRKRRGIATALLERRGYTLEVRVTNDGAIALYRGLGFTPRGIRRGYYTDNREDALIMWREAQPRSE